MKQNFYEKTWFIVLMAMFVPPIALALILIKKKNWNKFLKVVLTVLLAFWSLMWVIALFVPGDSVDTDTTTKQTVTETTTKEFVTTVKATTTQKATTTEEQTTKEETTEETTEKVSNITTQKAEVAQKVEEKISVESTSNTTKEQKEETTKKIVTTTKDPDASVIVYRTATGECYHYENPCGRGNYYEVSLADAKAAGLRPCEKCVLH